MFSLITTKCIILRPFLEGYALFPFIFSFACSAIRNGFAFDKLTNLFLQAKHGKTNMTFVAAQ